MTGVSESLSALVTEIDAVLADNQSAGSITAARFRQAMEDVIASVNAGNITATANITNGGTLTGTFAGTPTWSGTHTFSGGLTFQGGSGGVGSIYTDSNWGGLFRGRSGAVADLGFQTSGGTVAFEILNSPAVQVSNGVILQNNNPTQTLSGSQTPPAIFNFGVSLAGSSTSSSTNSYGANFGNASDTLSAPSLSYTTVNILSRPSAGWAGSRVGLTVNSQVNGATDLTASKAAGAGAVVAISTMATSQYNQGGASSGYGSTQFGLGALWGAVIQATLQTGATYYNSNCGVEIDSSGTSTTEVVENVGMKIVQYNANAMQGVLADVGLQVGGCQPTKAWKNAITIGSNIYGFGVDPNGYGLQFQSGAHGNSTYSCAGGIDLNQISFTGVGAVGGGFAYRSPGTQILSSGAHQIGPGHISFTGSALTLDVPWETVTAAAISSGGVNLTANDTIYSQDGTILRVTSVSGGAATAVAIIRSGWALASSLPSNPVTFTALGRVGSSIGSGVTVNLTWSSATTLNVGTSSATAINIGSSSSAVTINGRTLGQPYFQASLTSGNQTVTTGVATKVLFNSVNFDSGSYYDAVTNYRYTPLVAGKYRVTVAVQVTASSGSGNVMASLIYKNGSEIYRQSFSQANSTGYFNTMSCQAIVSLNGSSDYIEGWVIGEGSAGVAVESGAGLTWFEAFYIGP